MHDSATPGYSSRKLIGEELYASSRLEPTNKAGWAFRDNKKLDIA